MWWGFRKVFGVWRGGGRGVSDVSGMCQGVRGVSGIQGCVRDVSGMCQVCQGGVRDALGSRGCVGDSGMCQGCGRDLLVVYEARQGRVITSGIGNGFKDAAG